MQHYYSRMEQVDQENCGSQCGSSVRFDTQGKLKVLVPPHVTIILAYVPYRSLNSSLRRTLSHGRYITPLRTYQKPAVLPGYICDLSRRSCMSLSSNHPIKTRRICDHKAHWALFTSHWHAPSITQSSRSKLGSWMTNDPKYLLTTNAFHYSNQRPSDQRK
jgi:hypothetical protein